MSWPGPLSWLILAVVVIVLLHWLVHPIIIRVAQGEAVLIERLGVFHREVRAGWHLVYPLAERARPVEWRFTVQEYTALGAVSQRIEYFRGWRLPISQCTHQLVPSSFTWVTRAGR